MSGSYGWGQHCDRSRQRGHPIPAGKCRCGRQSLPENVVAVGNPCRILRQLGEAPNLKENDKKRSHFIEPE